MILKQYNDPKATALGVIDELLIPMLTEGVISLAVSGGSTPKQLFELMASDEYRDKIRWENLRLYWVDERCVPPSSEQSNYGMTAQALGLDTLPLSSEHIFRIKGENEPSEEAERYTQLVKTQLGQGGEDLPLFDLILLGIGDDGHTSSIFPHQMELLDSTSPYVVAHSPVGQARICLTGRTILAAKVLAFHAVGSNKRDILHQIYHAQPEAVAYPADYFAKHRKDILLFTDQEI